MLLPVSFFIGLRYSRSRNRSGFVSFITFFSIAGILLGVASLITVVSVMNGFEGELKKRILGLVPHIIVATNTDNMNNWQEKRKQLLSQPYVEQVTPFIEAEALIQSQGGLKAVLLQGVMPQYEKNNIINNHMISGNLESLSSTPYSLVLGQSLARQLKVNLFDKIRLVLPNKMVFTPMGRVPVQRTFTVTGIFNVGSQVDDAMVYVHTDSAAKLLRRKESGINQLRLYLSDAFQANYVAQQLDLNQYNSSNNDPNNYQVTVWNKSQGALFSAVQMEKNMMWLMLSLIIAVAAFNIVSALVMVVIDKQGEIGILQTLGMDRTGIVKIFITQGVVNALWGVVLGTALGLLLTFNLNTLLAALDVNILGAGYASQQLPINAELINIITIIFGALLMSFVATLYPAYRASKTQPAEVLRNE